MDRVISRYGTRRGHAVVGLAVLRLALLCVGGACSRGALGAGRIATDQRHAVLAADSAWAAAAVARDAERFLALYDPEVTFIAPNGAITRGEPLYARWRRVFAEPGYSLAWRAEAVTVSATGDLAYTAGPWREVHVRDGAPQIGEGRYVAVWRRQAAGQWKVLVDKP